MNRAMLHAVPFVLACLAASARAGVVSEVEPNDTQGQAQDVTAGFTLSGDPNINNSSTIPNVTIFMDGSTGNEDWFTFTTFAAGTIELDMDDAGSIPVGADYFTTMFDSSNSSVGGSDDGGNDAGDNGGFIGGDSNPHFSTGVLPAGTYFIQMNNFGGSQSGGSLNVSAIANPEPGTLALFALGFAGLAGTIAHKRRARRPAAV